MFNNQSYDEYIRSILGYSPVDQTDMLYQRDFEDYSLYDRNYSGVNNSNFSNDQLEECYPEIYKLVYPMVRKACTTNTKPVNKQLVDELTNEIYLSIEGNNEVQININLQNQIDKRSPSSNSNTKEITKNSSGSAKSENRENRQFNSGLSDIIRILLLRELLGRPGFPGPRPPRPPMRPPFPPPPPGRPQMRPPYNRELNDIYEY